MSVARELVLAGIVAVVAMAGWMLRSLWRLRRLERALDDVRDVLDELACGHLWVRAHRPPGVTEPVDRLAASVNELARALQAADAGRRRQDEAHRRLVADLSHDLRTPLTSIIGYLEAIRNGVGQDPGRYLDIVYARSSALARLVDDLLFLTRLEAGDRVVRPEPSDLSALVRQVCGDFAEECRGRGVDFSVETPGDGVHASVDRAAVARMVGNLLANALRHAGDMRRLTVRLDAAATIEVTNDGEPIPPGELPLIFERGHRGPHSTGSGLGLAIVRVLAEAHGGQLEATSDPEHRITTFRIRLPSTT